MSTVQAGGTFTVYVLHLEYTQPIRGGHIVTPYGTPRIWHYGKAGVAATQEISVRYLIKGAANARELIRAHGRNSKVSLSDYLEETATPIDYYPTGSATARHESRSWWIVEVQGVII